MEDDCAERLEAEIILPQSSVKPEYKAASKLLRWLVGEGARGGHAAKIMRVILTELDLI